MALFTRIRSCFVSAKYTVIHHNLRLLSTSARRFADKQIIDKDDDPSIIIPPYEEKINEVLSTTKARLLYQSRKRGMLENGLLLSTFAAKHLQEMTVEQTKLYDRLINQPSNDWEIYYWATGVKETPQEFDNEIMDLLKTHVKNNDKEARFRQPDL